jgi:sugar-specific transcriptional regulator TrmB
MSPKIAHILQGLNLNPGEQQAYITLLSQGEMSIKELSDLIGESRPNTYAIINKLASKKLVIVSGEKYGKKVSLDSVNKLSTLIKSEIDNLKGIQEELSEILPEMEHAQNTNPGLPAARYLSGEKGLNIALNEILNNPEAIRLYTNQEIEKTFFSRTQHQAFVRNRIDKNLKIKVLAVNNKDGIKLIQDDLRNLRETKLLPSNFSFSAETYILKNQIVMIDYDEVKKKVQCSIVRSHELVNIQKQTFDFLWSKI